MTPDALETLLRAWGRVYGERGTFTDDDPVGPSGYGSNPIATAMQFAPGKRSAVLRQRTTQMRGGVSRRRLMAIGAGVECLTVIPGSYVDPTPCRESRSVRNIARDWPVPPEVQRVQRAALDLISFDTERGICLRVHYCTFGNLDDKALDASQRLGFPLKVRAYRDAVAHARTWMHARLAA